MGAEADTKYYDAESSEVESQNIQKRIEVKQSTKTFTWEGQLLNLVGGVVWGALSHISASISKRPDGTCVVNFFLNITSNGYRTDNDPDRQENPPFILRFKNNIGANLFSVDIETEPYESHIYHGLTVRCHYNKEAKDSRYEVGVVPFDEIEFAGLKRGNGRPIYSCN